MFIRYLDWWSSFQAKKEVNNHPLLIFNTINLFGGLHRVYSSLEKHNLLRPWPFLSYFLPYFLNIFLFSNSPSLLPESPGKIFISAHIKEIVNFLCFSKGLLHSVLKLVHRFKGKQN